MPCMPFENVLRSSKFRMLNNRHNKLKSIMNESFVSALSYATVRYK